MPCGDEAPLRRLWQADRDTAEAVLDYLGQTRPHEGICVGTETSAAEAAEE